MSASHYYQPPFENVPDVPPVPFDNVIPVIPTYDPIKHNQEHRFCFDDGTCGCHEDQTLIAEVNEEVKQGLLTNEEATRLTQGRQL